MLLLGCSGWLLGCCYALARVFWVVPGAFLCGCKGVAMRLLGYSGWLLRCCYAVSRLFWMVSMELIHGC